jgi:hypothetical protein
MFKKIGNWLAKLFSDATTLGLIVTIGIFAFQSWETRNLEKSKFLTDYTKEFITSDMHQALIDIEYEKFDFKSLISKSQSEERLSKMLDFLNIVSYNVEKGYIPIEELRKSTLGYAIFVVNTTPEVSDYIQKIDERSWKRRHIPKNTAWGYLRGLKPRIIQEMRSPKNQ